MGGLLIEPSLSARLLAFDLPMIDTGIDTTVPEISSGVIVGVLYVLAASSTCSCRIPASTASR
jgi:LPLT family lysophospholipid transporter-like MFS transporter